MPESTHKAEDSTATEAVRTNEGLIQAIKSCQTYTTMIVVQVATDINVHLHKALTSISNKAILKAKQPLHSTKILRACILQTIQ